MSAKCQKQTSMDRANADSRAQAESDLTVAGDGTVKKTAPLGSILAGPLVFIGSNAVLRSVHVLV